MTKKILTSVILLSSITSALIADSTLEQRSTRLDSMELNNYMTKDSFNIFFNPANIATSKGGAFIEAALDTNDDTEDGNGGADTNGESSTNTSAMAGAIINLGNKGNLGVVLNRENKTGEMFGIAANSNTKQNNVDFLYGINVKDSVNLGVRLTYATVEKTDATSTNNLRVKTAEDTYNGTTSSVASTSEDVSATDITLELGAQFGAFDATVTYGMYDYDKSESGPANGIANAAVHGQTTTYNTTALDSTVTNITSNNKTENLSADGASLLEFALSYKYEIDEKSSITGYGVYSAADYSVAGDDMTSSSNTNYVTGTSQDNTTTTNNTNSKNSHTEDNILLGAAYNLKPTNNILVVVAAEYSNTKTEKSYADNVTANKTIASIFSTTPNTFNTTNGATGPQVVRDANNDIIGDETITEDDLSVVIAAEAYVTKSLALRFGLRESVYYTKSTDKSIDTANTTTYTNDDAVTTVGNTSNATSNTVSDRTTTDDESSSYQPNMQVAIGFGYQATKSITIDGLVNADLFLTGPDFISGGNQINRVNSRVAVNYNF